MNLFDVQSTRCLLTLFIFLSLFYFIHSNCHCLDTYKYTFSMCLFYLSLDELSLCLSLCALVFFSNFPSSRRWRSKLEREIETKILVSMWKVIQFWNDLSTAHSKSDIKLNFLIPRRASEASASSSSDEDVVDKIISLSLKKKNNQPATFI